MVKNPMAKNYFVDVLFLKKGFLRVIIYGVGVESSFQLDSSLSLEEEVKDLIRARTHTFFFF